MDLVNTLVDMTECLLLLLVAELNAMVMINEDGERPVRNPDSLVTTRGKLNRVVTMAREYTQHCPVAMIHYCKT